MIVSKGLSLDFNSKVGYKSKHHLNFSFIPIAKLQISGLK